MCSNKCRLSVSGWFHGKPFKRPPPYIEPIKHLSKPEDMDVSFPLFSCCLNMANSYQFNWCLGRQFLYLDQPGLSGSFHSRRRPVNFRRQVRNPATGVHSTRQVWRTMRSFALYRSLQLAPAEPCKQKTLRVHRIYLTSSLERSQEILSVGGIFSCPFELDWLKTAPTGFDAQ